MGEGDKPSQMESARTYISAFLGGGLTTAVVVGVFFFICAPADQTLVFAAALAGGLAGGVMATAIPPVRGWIARVTTLFLHLFPH